MKRTPTWYLVKSLVILTIIGVTFVYLNAKQNYFQQKQQHSRRLLKPQQQQQQRLTAEQQLRATTTTTTISSSSSSATVIKSLFGFSSSEMSSSLQNFTSTGEEGSSMVIMNTRDMDGNDGDDDNDGGDEDGNSKICHKVARYRNSKCEFVKTNCKSPLGGGLINYLKVKYCGFEKVQFMFFVFAVSKIYISSCVMPLMSIVLVAKIHYHDDDVFRFFGFCYYFTCCQILQRHTFALH